MSLSSAAQALPELHASLTADYYGAVLLFGAGGQEMARAGALELPQLTWDPLSDTSPLQGLPEGVSGDVEVLEAYGKPIGAIAWVSPEATAADGQAAAETFSRVLLQLSTLDYEIENLSRELAETYESVHLLCDVTDATIRTQTADDLCQEFLYQVARQISCRGGSVLLSTEGGQLRVAATVGEALDAARLFELNGVLGDVSRRRLAFVCDDVAEISALDTEDPVLDHARSSAVVTPMLAGEELLGMVVLFDRERTAIPEQPFDSRDCKLLDAVVTHAATMIQAMRLVEVSKEMEIGRRIQRALLPERLPQSTGWEVAGMCTMARVVGGDFYDVVQTEDDELKAVIADVSGHDLGAALLMATARGQFRVELRSQGGPGDTVRHINEQLHDDLTQAGLFLTYFVIGFQPNDRVLRYSAGGHNPPLLLRKGKRQAQLLDSPGMPAGVVRDAKFPEKQVAMESGDLLLLYTDGLTEASRLDGELFGEERLGEVLFSARDLAPSEILERIELEVREFTGHQEQQDDGTALLVRALDPRR